MALTNVERALRVLEGEPRVIGCEVHPDGAVARLTLSFRGCDDDAFDIDADLDSARFWFPEASS